MAAPVGYKSVASPYGGFASVDPPFEPRDTLIPFHPELDVAKAEALLRDTAYIDPSDATSGRVLSHGSPGTYLVIPSQSDRQKFKVVAVTETGDIKVETIRKVPGGWENATPGKVYRTYKDIIAHVLEGIRVLGECPGIPVFSTDQAKRAASLISASRPGTFVCFKPSDSSHLDEASSSFKEASNPRNVIMWLDETNELQTAEFHYTTSSYEVGALWKNGAPCKPLEAESEARYAGSLAGSTGGSASPYKPMPTEVLKKAILSELISTKLEKIPAAWLRETLALDTII